MVRAIVVASVEFASSYEIRTVLDCLPQRCNDKECLVLRYFLWIATNSGWRREGDLTGGQIDHGLEVLG